MFEDLRERIAAWITKRFHKEPVPVTEIDLRDDEALGAEGTPGNRNVPLAEVKHHKTGGLGLSLDFEDEYPSHKR